MLLVASAGGDQVRYGMHVGWSVLVESGREDAICRPKIQYFPPYILRFSTMPICTCIVVYFQDHRPVRSGKTTVLVLEDPRKLTVKKYMRNLSIRRRRKEKRRRRKGVRSSRFVVGRFVLCVINDDGGHPKSGRHCWRHSCTCANHGRVLREPRKRTGWATESIEYTNYAGKMTLPS